MLDAWRKRRVMRTRVLNQLRHTHGDGSAYDDDDDDGDDDVDDNDDDDDDDDDGCKINIVDLYI